jgi:hypothetical protein
MRLHLIGPAALAVGLAAEPVVALTVTQPLAEYRLAVIPYEPAKGSHDPIRPDGRTYSPERPISWISVPRWFSGNG